MGLVGIYDDLIGDKEVKGLKGHFISFLKGNPTTGGIKARSWIFSYPYLYL